MFSARARSIAVEPYAVLRKRTNTKIGDPYFD